jgi:helicase
MPTRVYKLSLLGKHVEIKQLAKEHTINLALDTIAKDKQALVFVNTKRSAEKEAESISKKTNLSCEALAEKVRKVLPTPTKQCERLFRCVQKGTAFHHAGLHSKQKTLVEDGFRDGTIKIIACTPTLAAGLDLPAFRAIIRDLKRFDSFGMNFIPVLEYHQMAGRAGRPKYDTFGEAICIANSEDDAEHIMEEYINGDPENILSKLAVEPVLRTYVLSLIVTRIARTEEQLMDFFSKTFWAHQYEDHDEIEEIISRMVNLLEEIEQIKKGKTLEATRLGRRVAELYIDPLTAHSLRKRLHTDMSDTGMLYLLCDCVEMKPLFSIRQAEYDDIEAVATKEGIDDMFNEDYLPAVKTAAVLVDWMDEKNEAFILEHRNITPGELRNKIEKAKWLSYAAMEIAKISGQRELSKRVYKTKLRLEKGVKEELLDLIRFKGIGRVRARTLFNNGLKTATEVKRAKFDILNRLLGQAVARDLKKQVGENVVQSRLA